MFHVKQRHLSLIAGVTMLGLLATACGGGAAGPRGWAEPIQSGKTVLVSAHRGKIDGIDTDTNLLRWQFPGGWEINGDDSDLKGIYGPPVVASDNDTTFVADYNGIIYAFKQSEGRAQPPNPKPIAAAMNLGEPVIGGIVIDKSTNDLYVTSGARLLKLKFASSGGSSGFTTEWAFETGADIWGVPVISNGRILFTSLDGHLYSINMSDGTQVWKYSTGGSGLVSTPFVSNGTVYAGGFDSKLHAVDLASGEEKWTFQASYWVWTTPIADGSRIIFGDFDSKLYAVNATDGVEAWQMDLGHGAIVGAPIITQGTLVVGTEDGWLGGIDTSNQSIKWQTDLDTGFASDLTLATDGSVLIAPKGCVTREGIEQKTYFYAVNASNGELKQAQDVC
jgi:outer membrane protein assembly factor BamB